ncbi:MAG: LTA synthase family protein, partial [Rickettsiales bacterium]|nr:LTA synthase family protein [Rickettsiales bacterium]
MKGFLKRLLPFAAVYYIVETLLRLSLLARVYWSVEITPAQALQVMLRGLWFDTVTAGFLLLPVALYLAFLPSRKCGGGMDKRVDAALRMLFIFVLLFDAVAEHLFWSEFSTRFNFIAVDYLIYTQEVVGNIRESYSLGWIIMGIVAATFVLACGSYVFFPITGRKVYTRGRAVGVAALLALCASGYAVSDLSQGEIDDNAQATEAADNGIYNLFYAAIHNEIAYDRFYRHEDDAKVYANARALLWEQDAQFVHDDGKDLTRLVQAHGAELHKNVIIVTMESMSADYMGAFGNTSGLTPNLDRLAKEGLSFTQLYATGTRTVRGLEALTLSIPPTPGQSIVRRPGNENLFSLGFIFKDRGYDTTFIYGGYGYFDNMNAFFAGNGFDVLDRNDMASDEVNFANVWGICDEDMFLRAIREADASYAKGRPFMQLVMTTSNHRPYTYPEGRIDIPSHSNRLGGVKYADYSVGQLVEQAKNKPWFKDTVFVFVADHTAGAGSRTELDPVKYHIPMIFYSPGFIEPKEFTPIASQIDMAPVLLGMLNFTYYTKFFGEDVIHDLNEVPHAFISNFQKVALVKDNELNVLGPKRKLEQYHWPTMESYEEEGDTEVLDAITYYQSASLWKEQYKRIPTVVKHVSVVEDSASR